MLDRHIQPAAVAKVIDSLPCRVLLPDSLREQFECCGPAPTKHDDRRRFPRLRCRSLDHRAAVQCRPTFPAVARGDAWSAAYVTDISRSGLQILHAEQLYPGERVRVLLLTGTDVIMQVVCTRRLGEACFAVGLRVEGDEAAAVTDGRRSSREKRSDSAII